MRSLPPLLCLALALGVLAPRAKAWEVSLAPALHLELQASAAPRLPPALTLTGHRAALSAALASAAPSVTLTERASEGDRQVRRQLGRAGYALAVGLGMTVGGVSIAAQTRPNRTELGGGVCYEDPNDERLFLGIASGFMAVGLVISSSAIVRLVQLRREHPGVRVSAGARGAQVLIGLASAATTAGLLFGATIPCLSS